MRRLWKKLSRFAHSRNVAVFCILIVFGLFFASSYVSADNGSVGSIVGGAAVSTANWFIEGITNVILAISRVFLGLTISSLRIFTMLAAYNDYIDSPPVVVGWYMVRDLANMFFVVALLVIAFGTMLGLEQYEWKKSLVKLVLSAILINFSRLIIGLAIDVAHVFTITFLGAVQGVAAGNLIGMFHLDKVFNLATGGLPPNENLRLDLLGAAIMSVIFSLTAMVAVGSYLVVMAIRVVVLWVLIILSPLAFVLSAIPQTKGYADEFWGEVSKHIIVAPVMVFFLWLAFATLGNGQINNHVGIKSGGVGSADTVRALGLPNNTSGSVSLLELSTWENMSGFIIAIVFLMVGLEQVQKVGATGSSFVSGAIDFSKRAATVVSGLAAARFVKEKATDLSVEGLKAGAGLAYGATIGGFVERNLVNPIKNIPNQYRLWRAKGPPLVTELKDQKAKELVDENGVSRSLTADEIESGLKEYVNARTGKRYVMTKEDVKAGLEVDEDGFLLDRYGNRKQRRENAREKIAEYERATEADRAAGLADAQGYKLKRDPATGNLVKVQAQEDVLATYADRAAGLADAQGYKLDRPGGQRVKQAKYIEGGVIFDKKWKPSYLQNRYQKLLESRKILEKTEKQANIREELKMKRTAGVPRKLFGAEAFEDTPDAEDRIEQGQLNAEEARSGAKTQEFNALGEKVVQQNARFKDGRFQEEKSSIAQQVADHEAKAEATQALLSIITNKAKLSAVSGKNERLIRAKVFGKIQAEAPEAQRGKIEATQQAQLAQTEATTFEAVQNKVAAERQAHEEGLKFEIETLRADNLYLQSPAGQHDLQAGAVLHQEKTKEEEYIKGAEADANASVFTVAGAGPKTAEQQLLEDIERRRVSTAASEAKFKSAEAEAKSDAGELLSAELEAEAAAGQLTAKSEAEAARQRAEATEAAARADSRPIVDAEKQKILTAAAEAQAKEITEESRLEATDLLGAEVEAKAAAEIRADAVARDIAAREAAAQSVAAGTETGALLRGATADIDKAAEEAVAKRIQSEQKAEAERIQSSVLQATQEETIKTAEQEAVSKLQQEAAKRVATEAQKEALVRARQANIKAGAETAGIESEEALAQRKALQREKSSGILAETERSKAEKVLQEGKGKEIEKAVAAEFAGSQVGRDLAKEAKQAEVRTGQSEAEIKEADAAALRRAQEIERKSLVGKERADVRATAESDEAKKQVEAAKKEATEEEKDAILRSARAKELAKALADETSAILSQATKNAVQSLGAGLMTRLNLSEQAKKAADDFVKQLRSKDLAKQFDEAGKTMNKWFKLSATDFKKQIKEAQQGKISGPQGVYIAALASAQTAKLQEESTALRRRQAEDASHDAFVYKPRYGTTSASTAYSQFVKGQMDELRQLERAAAMKKATDIMANMASIKESGGKLEVDQEAQLAAAVTFLTEEAWADDQGDYVNDMLQKLQKGDFDKRTGDPVKDAALAEEKKKWQAMAKMFDKLGWITNGVDSSGKALSSVDASGNILATAKIKDQYGRKEAADLQNLALTGLDSDLVKAHQVISEVVDKNKAIIDEESQKIHETELSAAMVDPAYKRDKIEAAKTAALEAKQAIVKDKKDTLMMTRKIAETDGKAAGKTGNDLKKFVEDAVTQKQIELESKKQKDKDNETIRQAIEEAQKVTVSKKIKDAVEAKVKLKIDSLEASGVVADYWKAADLVLPTAGVNGLVNKAALKDRYEDYADVMQFATRTFKKNAVDNGHEELGMNQDFDENEDVYRFQTVREGAAKLRADRVKIATQKLTTTDQYHSNGILDNETGIIDDFLEATLSTTLGKVTKAIEIANMPERSLKGHFYVHKNEDAQVVTRINRTTGESTRYAVAGGDSARKKFSKKDNDTSDKAQANHMLARGFLKTLMAGGARGLTIAASKLYGGHINERQAQAGIINLQLGSSDEDRFHTVQDMARTIYERLSRKDADFMKSFNASGYVGQEQRVLRQMQQIMNEKPKSDFSRPDEENQAIAG